MDKAFNTFTYKVPEELESLYPLESLVYIDIETTGFSANYHQIINIGLLYYDHQWRFIQYWASTLDEEKQMLQQFSTFDSPNTLYLCYNGKTFDLPFILKRLAFHKLPTINLRHRVLDFISLGRSFCKEKHLSSYSFKSLEHYFGLDRGEDVAGEEVIHAFSTYLTTSDPLYKNAILKHNERDVTHMPFILSQLSKDLGPQLSHITPLIFILNGYTLALNLHFDKEQMILSGDILPELPVPLEVIAGVEFSCHKNKIQIKLPLIPLKAGNHFFLRLDWDHSVAATSTPYDTLSISEKTKLIFEIDGMVQIDSVINYLKNTLSSWIN